MLFHVKKPGLELKKTGSVILNFPVARWLSSGNILMPSVFYLPNMKMILLSFMLLLDLWLKLMRDEKSKKKKTNKSDYISISSFLNSSVLPNFENK